MKFSVKDNSKNYCATVVKIKELYNIEGADRLKRTVVFGNNVVVGLDVKIGDSMLYFNSGTKLNEEYCKYNNLLTDATLNKDNKVGFISHKQFRVKAIKLRGVISDGILLPISSLLCFISDISKLENSEGLEFTDIDNISICEKYFVPIKNSNPGGKAPKQPTKISRLVEGQFYLHGDTDNLRRNIDKLNLDDIIGIHYKKHGTSVVISNCLVKKELTWYEKLLKKIGVNVVDTKYDILYSSRKVLKNAYLNTNSNSFYSSDIWGEVAKEVGDKIPKGYSIYGEILGYTEDGAAIQKNYSYGCLQGKHKFYVYKISIVNEDGKVIYLTDKQIEEFCEKNGLLYKDTFIYYGTIFKHIPLKIISNLDSEWRNSYLKYLEQEYTEKDCYMNPGQPEEGIILRVEKLESYEAYKLKSHKFLLKESELQEKDETNLEDNQNE
jgi:hypothetical protein